MLQGVWISSPLWSVTPSQLSLCRRDAVLIDFCWVLQSYTVIRLSHHCPASLGPSPHGRGQKRMMAPYWAAPLSSAALRMWPSDASSAPQSAPERFAKETNTERSTATRSEGLKFTLYLFLYIVHYIYTVYPLLAGVVSLSSATSSLGAQGTSAFPIFKFVSSTYLSVKTTQNESAVLNQCDVGMTTKSICPFLHNIQGHAKMVLVSQKDSMKA